MIIFTAILAVLCEIVPLTLLYSSIKHIGSLRVSIIGNLEIPVAIIFSYFALGERINIAQILGACMVVYAAYTVQKIEN
ncbi:EamA family transporter [Clostridium sp. 19966]|nr:EamA family transporter [Clostridium sp. 19966]MDT8718585.1 EamA family transporter [Clostridium sp. 19966]